MNVDGKAFAANAVRRLTPCSLHNEMLIACPHRSPTPRPATRNPPSPRQLPSPQCTPHTRGLGCTACSLAGRAQPAPRPRAVSVAVQTQAVQRAAHAATTPIQHVSVDHRRLHAVVTEQFLDRPDVVAVL